MCQRPVGPIWPHVNISDLRNPFILLVLVARGNDALVTHLGQIPSITESAPLANTSVARCYCRLKLMYSALDFGPCAIEFDTPDVRDHVKLGLWYS